MNHMTSRTITYHFAFTDGSSWKYELEFDRDFRFINTKDTPAKPWTALDFNQCPHCPLNKVTTPQCPVARNLDQIVEDSKNTISYTPATVSVITAERTYVKKCATQEGLRSLFGMIMGASGCPHLDWFRPMARFHLPFSDSEETLFRVLSLQLLTFFLRTWEVVLDSVLSKFKLDMMQLQKLIILLSNEFTRIAKPMLIKTPWLHWICFLNFSSFNRLCGLSQFKVTSNRKRVLRR